MSPAGPYPTKAMFQSLQAQVSTLKQSDTSVARLQDSGPDFVYILDSAQNPVPKLAKKLALMHSPSDSLSRILSEVRVQVPNGASLPAGAVSVMVGVSPAVSAPNLGRELLEVGGVTWLCIKVRAYVGAADEMVRIEFATPYAVLYTAAQVQDASYVVWFTDENGVETNPTVGVHFVTAGARNVVGPIAPDAMRVVSHPTPLGQMQNNDFEIVVPSDDPTASGSGQVPYLRLRSWDKEYRLDMVAVQSGGGGGGEAT